MMVYMIVLLANLVAAASLNADQVKFANFVSKFGRQYQTQEEWDKRYELFMKKDRRISELNNEGLTSTHGHTIFSDWTDEEY